MASYKFPADINTSRPVIVFQCLSVGGPQIVLPAPGSLQFSDAATYNDVELGIRGAMTAQAASGITAGGLGLDNLKGIAGNAIDSIKSAITGNNVGGIMQGIAAAIPGLGDSYKSAISIGTGTTVNKNITTEFTSTNTRAFSFDFQLIPQNESDNETIRRIVSSFRENLYPEGNNFQLKYPPKWTIAYGFLKNLPTIGEVYLREMNTSYNTSANMWRADGSPFETSIQLSFMETKAYTRETLPGVGVSTFEGDGNISTNPNVANIA